MEGKGEQSGERKERTARSARQGPGQKPESGVRIVTLAHQLSVGSHSTVMHRLKPRCGLVLSCSPSGQKGYHSHGECS